MKILIMGAGAIVRLGKVHGINAPVNEAIVNIIKTLERMYGVSNLN
jgi:ketopantoate reductase